MHHSAGFMELTNMLKATVKEEDIHQVNNRIHSNNENLALIDVRENEEWDEGYIPGAIHLSKGIIERDIEKIIPDKSIEIILYCGGGYRSLIAADSLQKMGYQNIVSMSGGISAWKAAGFPIEED